VLTPHNRIIRFVPGELSGPVVRFHCDEDVNLKRLVPMLRDRGFDVTTSPGVGLLGTSDLEQLRFAAREGRVFITNDTLHFSVLAFEEPHAGVLLCNGGGRFPRDVLRRCLEIRESRAAARERPVAPPRAACGTLLHGGAEPSRVADPDACAPRER
jgi:hypothetical protein